MPRIPEFQGPEPKVLRNLLDSGSVRHHWDYGIRGTGLAPDKTILFTDNDDWTDAEIVRAYRAQHHIEGAFRGMKDPHCIALRPQHHWTDQKVRVHVLTCVVALMLLSLLQRELHRHGIDCSFRRMTQLLGGIREVIIATPATGGAKPSLRFALSRMSPEQRQMYEILRLDRYTNAA